MLQRNIQVDVASNLHFSARTEEFWHSELTIFPFRWRFKAKPKKLDSMNRPTDSLASTELSGTNLGARNILY